VGAPGVEREEEGVRSGIGVPRADGCRWSLSPPSSSSSERARLRLIDAEPDDDDASPAFGAAFISTSGVEVVSTEIRKAYQLVSLYESGKCIISTHLAARKAHLAFVNPDGRYSRMTYVNDDLRCGCCCCRSWITVVVVSSRV